MKPKRRAASPALMAAVLFLLIPVCARAQASEPAWEKVAPPGEEFTALMPGKPSIETEKVPYGQITLSSVYYTVATADGPFFLIASTGGMESFLALLSEKDRLKSASEGFRESFLKEVRAKGSRADMTFKREITSGGHAGIEYDITIGEIGGLVQIYSTRKKIYALMVLNALEGDERAKRFLNSFTLKAPLSTVTGRPVNGLKGSVGEGDPPLPAVDSGNLRRGPIQGGVLNGKAIRLPKPLYPQEAREARAAGLVTVRIIIDENGEVTEAHAVSGHELLREAAVTAAFGAKFTPTTLSGQPVKVTGVITYNFVAQ